ncbi:uncharacterized protein LOC111642107 [Centruroides sculpturatus]|uniref:uncharacterized protein LOC111642107 n=1 Tax=Centruroides sculpturatus TaxID=218467 RepID=UPI000C6E5F15|nr:uncharacterized protein LOC111642107 [Centruroides sculpturatus]
MNYHVIDMDFYHLCIVGAGMIGSATARHASADPSLKVCLIGPDEPKDWNNVDIFSAHYDEGRLTYVIQDCVVDHQLTKCSMARYREIEKLSGISFYNPVGCLYIGEKNIDHTVRLQNACVVNNVPVEDLSDDSMFKQKFPFMNLREDEVALFDYTGAGYISARNLVAAQQEISRRQGCTIIRDVVSSIEEFNHSNDNIVLKITTDCGNIIEAQRVVICTGAFTNFRQLLPNYGILSPDMEITEDSVALLEISEDEAERLNHWVIKGPNGKTCTRGEPISCGDTIRLEHLITQKHLHSHLFSPLSGNQEVTAFGDKGEGDSGDHWVVTCNGQY